MTQLAERKPNGKEDALVLTSPGPQAVTPMHLLEIATSQNADIDKLKQLMDLQERWEKNEARKAFVEAMNVFKLNPPQIIKDHQVSFGTTNYKHATLANVVRAVTETLSAVGISHRWTVKQDEKYISVACVLTHKMGHSEETVLMGPTDTSGSKNPIQAIGSTVTYLQRYTLMAACGLAAGDDDDGRGAVGQQPTNGNVAEQIEWLMNAKDMDELQKLFKQAYTKFGGNSGAQKALITAKDSRKKELQ
jgi:hypothetical protein